LGTDDMTTQKKKGGKDRIHCSTNEGVSWRLCPIEHASNERQIGKASEKKKRGREGHNCLRPGRRRNKRGL